MTVPVRFKKTAIVGILALSAVGLSACGDNRNCVPNASGPTSVERVSSIEDNAVASLTAPMKGGGGGGKGGGGSKGGSSTKSGTTGGSTSHKKSSSSTGGFWFFGGGGSRSCPAGQHLK